MSVESPFNMSQDEPSPDHRKKSKKKKKNKDHRPDAENNLDTSYTSCTSVSEAEINKDLVSMAKRISEHQASLSDSDFSLNWGSPKRVKKVKVQARTPVSRTSISSTVELPSTSAGTPTRRIETNKEKQQVNLRYDAGPSQDVVDFQVEDMVTWTGKGDQKLWLIQLPADVKVEELDGISCDMKRGVSLPREPEDSSWQGLDISVKKNSKKFKMTDMTVLLPDDSGSLQSVGPFVGQVTVTKRVNMTVNDETLIKPKQIPQIPQGLKHRVTAFGGDGPVVPGKRSHSPSKKHKKMHQSSTEVGEVESQKEKKKHKKKKKKKHKSH